MSFGRLSVRYSFGISPNRNCVTFLEDRTVVYVCGHQVVTINTDNKEQNFIPLGGTPQYPYKSYGVTSISSCLPKKFIAIAEKTDTVGIVSFFDSNSLRKKKILNYPDLGSHEIRCIAFSEDGKFCLTQGGGPEWTLVLWNVEKAAKVVATIKTSNSDENPVHQISFCPTDPTLILVTGRTISKFYKLTPEGQLRGHSLSIRRDQANILAHCWLDNDYLLLGTELGEILLVEGMEFRAVVYPTTSDAAEEAQPVLSFSPTSRGFLVGTTDGQVRIFEKQEEIKEIFQLSEIIYCLPTRRGSILSILAADEQLLLLTDKQQLLATTMSTLQSVRDHSISLAGGAKDGSSAFEPLLTSFHGPNDRGEAAITGMDVGLWKQVVATCGKDKTVRIWNPSDKRLELMKEFEDEPVSVALHPSGMYLAVAFLDKIRVLSILLDQMKISHEIIVRNCAFIKFSHGGHYIAAANGSNVQIFNSFTGATICTLRGHQQRIRSINWMAFDSKLMTIGSEGIVFFWDLFPIPTRRPEQYSAMTDFLAGTGYSDGTKAYAVTGDRFLREIQFIKQVDPTTGQEIDLRDMKEMEIGQSVVSMIVEENRKLLLLGTNSEEGPGSILSIQTLPSLSSTVEMVSIHSAPITCMALSFNRSTLYSADANGCLCISEFETTSGVSQAKLDALMPKEFEHFKFVDEVMVNKSELDHRKAMLKELQARVEDLTLNNEYQIRLKEAEHNERVHDITFKFTSQLQKERENYEALLKEKQLFEKNFRARLLVIDVQQKTEMKDIDVKYRAKINAEGNRKKVLIEESERLHQRWNEENRDLVSSHQMYLQEMSEGFEDKLHYEQKAQRELLQIKENFKVTHESSVKDTETDAEGEIYEMEAKYKLKLSQEDQASLELMTTHAKMKRDLQVLTKDSDAQKEDIKRMRDKEARLNESIRSLEKDIQSHKKEIREREETITDKEKRIFDLKKKNQELEKFRFVLDYKIKELKLQISPREAEIATMRRQIEEMGLELEQYHKSNQALNLMIDELKLKMDGIRREFASQEERIDTNLKLMDRYKRDLQDILEVKDDYNQLKIKSVKLYRIYVQEDLARALDSSKGSSRPAESGSEASTDPSDPQIMYNRDREQLERSLDALKRSLKTDTVAHKRDYSKMMRDSMLLTNELNELRKEARLMQLQKRAVADQLSKLKVPGGAANLDLEDLMDALSIQIRNPSSSTRGTSKGGSAIKLEDSVTSNKDKASQTSKLAPIPPSQLRSASAGGPGTAGGRASRGAVKRSAALRTTSADGTTSGANEGGEGPSRISSMNKNDQWSAWREIQIQHDQMTQLETQLHTLCTGMGVNPLHVIAGIDANIMLQTSQKK